MKNIIKTTQIEYTKSNFLIDLIKHNNDILYIEITQTIRNKNGLTNSIIINPANLDNFISVLQVYRDEINSLSPTKSKYLKNDEQRKIEEYYLKGIPAKDIAMQLEYSEELIYMILRNRNSI